MSQSIKTIYLLLTGLIILALFIAVKQGKLLGITADIKTTPASTQSLDTKTDNQGSVLLEVTPITLKIEEPPEFKVSFNTHSVDLDFAVDQIARLTDQDGQVIGTARWDGAPPGGHHRSGRLSFDTKLPIETSAVTLTFTNIAGITERTFVWTITKQ